MHHRDVHVGSFFLAGKEGGQEFTDEDEEVLVLFASQAAAAIVNARTYRAEQRGRADLETLVDTSPVGVVVFHARTGNPVSLNLEARRIVEGLRMSGRSTEELLEVMTYRRADGREIALGEFALARELSSGETVHAEEIVLSVPDGRHADRWRRREPYRERRRQNHHPADSRRTDVPLRQPGAAGGCRVPLQRRLQDEGPYVIMFQQTEQMARRRTTAGLVTGPAFDQTWYRTVTKQPATAR